MAELPVDENKKPFKVMVGHEKLLGYLTSIIACKIDMKAKQATRVVLHTKSLRILINLSHDDDVKERLIVDHEILNIVEELTQEHFCDKSCSAS